MTPDDRKSKQRKLYDSWKSIVAHYQKMQRTSLLLFSRPDATDEMILEVAKRLGETRRSLLDIQRRTADALNGNVLRDYVVYTNI